MALFSNSSLLDLEQLWTAVLCPAELPLISSKPVCLAGEHARAIPKILKRDPSSEAASPHEDAPPHSPAAQATPSAPPLPAAAAAEMTQVRPAPNTASVQPQLPSALSGAQQPPVASAGQGQPASATALGARPLPPGMSQPAQTPAGLAAAAAAQAALAAPPPPLKQVPKYNPPGNAHHLHPDHAAQQKGKQQQQQQQPLSATDGPDRQQVNRLGQQAPMFHQNQTRPDAHASHPSANAPPHPAQLTGLRPQMQPTVPHSSSSSSMPSQQITAQARASQAQQSQGQPGGNVGANGPPPSFLQFGSMQPIPSSGNGPAAAAGSNPLTFGIPAGMTPGSSNGNGAARQNASQAPQGRLNPQPSSCAIAHVLKLAYGNKFDCDWSL